MAKTLIIKYITLTNVGGTETIDVTEPVDLYVIMGTGAMAGNWTVAPSAAQGDTNVKILMQTTLTLNGNTFTVFGQSLSQKQLTATQIESTYSSSTSAWITAVYAFFNGTGFISTTMIGDGAVTNAQLADLTRGYIKVGDATNAPADVDFSANGNIGIGDGTDYNSVAITGDITLSSAGVTAIAAGAIVNADVNAAAAIAYSKLAALPSAQILVGSAGNVATAVAMSGDVAISNTGVTTIQAASVDVAMLSGTLTKEVFVIPVSFQAGEQANNSFVIPFDGTIDDLTSYVTLALAATDDATITAQIGGVAVTNGQITLNASSALNTSDSATPTALNVFAAGDRIDLVGAKTTAGGKALVSVTVTRT